MSKINSLNEIIGFDESFKSSINLYLNMNNKEKVLRYIPTKSSVQFLNEYLLSVKNNKEQASLLIGPYGKGKSHLLLVLLAVISMERNEENCNMIDNLVSRIKRVDDIGEEVANNIKYIWNNKGRFLPVLITNTQEDLNQAFLYALNDALKRERISELIPDTYYSLAIEKIQSWQKDYPETYDLLVQKVSEYGMSIIELQAGLSAFSRKELKIFTTVYPELTSGGEFNPMAVSDPLSLYKNVSEKLVEEYAYSGIYIVFDEFSKYIESQNGNASGANMKLLQDMCELANDSKNAQVFMTMVAHKSIKEYGKYLSVETINAFTGIEGRIVEKLFVTSSKNNYELIKNAIIKKVDIKSVPELDSYIGKCRLEQFYKVPAFKSKFDKRDFNNIILEGCYPLNPISAYLLLNISEKVAQNERTLFTFISNDEPNSMARYIANHTSDMVWSIGADLIYDYFAGLFKKEVINEHVHNEWLNAEYAISKCMSDEQRKVVKALAIFLIVNKEEEMPAEESLLGLSTGISNISEIVEELVVNQVVYKKGSSNTLVFKTRAGSALKSEIKKLRSIKSDKVNYSQVFEGITKKYYVIPRKYNADHMMTRYYRHEYMDVATFMDITNAEVFVDANSFADGKVVSLYSTGKIDVTRVRKHIKELACKKVVVICPTKSFDKVKQALDYEILQELKNNHAFTSDNEIMKKELPILEEDLAKELEECLFRIYEEDEACTVFFLKGEILSSRRGIEVEKVVSDCCASIYEKTPLINNELINRQEISTGQTKKARLNIIHAILNHEDTGSFYSGTNQEATIYRSLFCGTGIRDNQPGEEINEVLFIINEFLESCSEQKRGLKELLDTLTTEPYGMRKGVIPIYLSYLLSRRNEDIVVYFSDMEVQISAEIIVNMCEKPMDYALFMSKADLEKEKYIESLNELFGVKDNRNLSVNRIKNILICMQRWFRALPTVTRNASDFSEYDKAEELSTLLVRVRRVLQKVDFNPYEELFFRFPEIFGTENDLEATYIMLDKCKTAFDDYYDWVLQVAVRGTHEVFASRKNQDLYHVTKEWFEKQSDISKNGLHGGRITNLMSCIDKMNVYDDVEVSKKLIKAVTDVYVENWNGSSYQEYVSALQSVKSAIENLKDQKTDDKLELSFIGKNGNPIKKFYEPVTESTGTVLRNIIEDTLEEYDDLSMNDRVAILLEMIEKVIS